MTIAALPSKPAVITMVLGLAISAVCLGYAILEFGVPQRRLASLQQRIESVDQHIRGVGQRHRAGLLSREGARTEHVRLAADRDSLLIALRSLAEQRSHEASDAYLLLGGCVLGLLLFGNGYRENVTEQADAHAWRSAAELHAMGAQQAGRARRTSGGVNVHETGELHGDTRIKRVDYLPAREATFDREPQDLHHAVLRIRHLTGEHLAVPRDLQLRAAHAIADSDSPEAALRALHVSGVLHVLDGAGANTSRLTGAIPEIWHRFHPD